MPSRKAIPLTLHLTEKLRTRLQLPPLPPAVLSPVGVPGTGAHGALRAGESLAMKKRQAPGAQDGGGADEGRDDWNLVNCEGWMPGPLGAVTVALSQTGMSAPLEGLGHSCLRGGARPTARARRWCGAI